MSREGSTAENGLPVYRGRLYHPDGSYSPVERWVRATNGDWISLDSERRTSRDLLLEPDAAVGFDVHTDNPYGGDGDA